MAPSLTFPFYPVRVVLRLFLLAAIGAIFSVGQQALLTRPKHTKTDTINQQAADFQINTKPPSLHSLEGATERFFGVVSARFLRTTAHRNLDNSPNPPPATCTDSPPRILRSLLLKSIQPRDNNEEPVSLILTDNTPIRVPSDVILYHDA